MISVIQFDFTRKQENNIPAEKIADVLRTGCFCWVDVDGTTCSSSDEAHRRVEQLFESLGINEVARREVFGPDREGRYDVYEDCLHFAVTEALLVDQRLQTSHLDVVLGERFLVTFRRHANGTVASMKRTYREDFHKFAQSPGFLLYEIADHLASTYRRSLQQLADAVEGVQLQMYGEVDDTIFRRVSSLMQDLLGLRKVVTSARELFHELATRRSAFVPDSTRPFLDNMAGTLQRLSDDLTTEREVLNEMLNLYMGMVSHRTNKVINRLTIISVIFLPLTFICGVYGMNFNGIPELEWGHGYVYFWSLCLVIAASLALYMRRKKWL